MNFQNKIKQEEFNLATMIGRHATVYTAAAFMALSASALENSFEVYDAARDVGGFALGTMGLRTGWSYQGSGADRELHL